MNISTKFDVGETAWLMVNNKAVSAKVERVTFTACSQPLTQKPVTNESVALNTEDFEDKRKNVFAARSLFKSKADLLVSL